MKYKTFKVDLTPTEFNLIDTFCKQKNMSKATFLRLCMEDKGLKDFDDSIKYDFKETDLKSCLIKTYLYKDFNVLIFKEGISFSCYINAVNNGITMFCFGCESDDYIEFLRLVKNNIDDYISIYIDNYNY